MLEHAVAKAMPHGVRRRAARRQQGRRPVVPGDLVADIDRLGVGVADGVVRPRCEPELVRVLAPGAGAAGLRQQRPEAGIGDHVGPGRRGHAIGRHDDPVFAQVRRETAATIEGDESGAVRQRRRCHLSFRPRRAGPFRRNRARGPRVDEALLGAIDLLHQARACVQDDVGDALQERAIAVVEQRHVADEYAAGLGDMARTWPVADRTLNALDQGRVLRHGGAGDDHQLGVDAVSAPERMGLHDLPDDAEAFGIRHLQQHDRNIAREAEAPERRLAAPVRGDVGARAPRGAGGDHASHQALVEKPLVRRRADPRQGRCPIPARPVHDSMPGVGPSALVGQRDACAAGRANAGEPVDGARLALTEHELDPDRRDGVEHRAGVTRQRPAPLQRARGRDVSSAPDEAQSVGLERNLVAVTVRDGLVEEPRVRIVGGARPSRRENGAQRGIDPGFDEQLAEGRLGCVGRGPGQHDLGKAGRAQRTPTRGPVGDAKPAQFDVAALRHGHLQAGLDIAFEAREAGGRGIETDNTLRRDRPGRRGPEMSALIVPQVDESAARVEHRIVAPARHGQVVPSAVSGAFGAEQDVVLSIGKQGHGCHVCDREDAGDDVERSRNRRPRS